MSVLAAVWALAAPAGAAADDAATSFQGNPGHTGVVSGGSLDRPPLVKRWERQLGTRTSHPLIVEDKAFISTYDPARSGATIMALDLTTGETLWQREHAAFAQLAYDGGRIFALEESGVMTAVSASSGATLWTRLVMEPFDASAPVASAGLVYVGLSWSGGSVWALDAATGDTRWSTPVYYADSPAVDGRYVYAYEDHACQTSAFDRTTGDWAWTSSPDCWLGASPPVASGSRVVARTGSGGMVMDSATGKISDTMPLSGSPALAGPVAVVANNRVLQARGLRTGTTRWEHVAADRLSPHPLVVNHVAYIGVATGHLEAVDLATGTRIWSDAIGKGASGETPGAAGMASAGGSLLVPVGGRLVAYSDAALTDRPGLSVEITGGPDGPTRADSASFSFTGSALAPTECRLDGEAWKACTSPASYADLADGPHDFEVRTLDSTDGSGVGLAARGWSVRTQAPKTTITSGPAEVSSSATASFGLDSEADAAELECRLDGGSWSPCGYDGYSWRQSYTDLADGRHTFEARGTDALGNVEEPPVSRTWRIDSRAPNTAVTEGPPDPSYSSRARFVMTADEPGATFQCQLDLGEWSPCESTKEYEGLSEGRHTFRARAKDAVGNVDASPAERSWLVDAVDPDVTITRGPFGVTRSRDAVFEFSASEAVIRFECRLDEGAWQTCSSPLTRSALPDGPHSFAVRAYDAGGSVDLTPAIRDWIVDVDAPRTLLNQSASGPTGANAARFEFTSSEPRSSFVCALDDAPATPCESPATYAALAPGEHRFRVHAIDAAGTRDPDGAAMTFSIRESDTGPGVTTPPIALQPPRTTSTGQSPPAVPTRASRPSDLAEALRRVLRVPRLRALAAQRDIFAPYRSPGAGVLRVALRVKVKSRSGRVGRAGLANGSVRFVRPEARLIRLQLTARGRRLLRAASEARMTIDVGFRDARGRLERSRRSVRVHRR